MGIDTISRHKKANFKCPDCNNKYISEYLLLRHVNIEHKENIPKGVTTKQYCFNRRNNKTFQICVICKKNKTKWNEESGRYNRFCSEECKKKAGEIAEANLKKKTGMGRRERLNNEEVQRSMLHNRSISGTYYFKDKKHSITFTGSYELDFLNFYENVYKGSPLDIMECPFTFNYIYENKRHFYIPDYYIPTLNLIIEIKDGGDNPNTHPKIVAVDKVKETLKDDAIMITQTYNYIKICNKEYDDFIKITQIIKERNESQEPFNPIIQI